MLKIAHLQGGNFIFRLFVFQNSLFVQEPEGEPFFRKQKRDIAVCGGEATVSRTCGRIALCPGFQNQLVEPE